MNGQFCLFLEAEYDDGPEQWDKTDENEVEFLVIALKRERSIVGVN